MHGKNHHQARKTAPSQQRTLGTPYITGQQQSLRVWNLYTSSPPIVDINQQHADRRSSMLPPHGASQELRADRGAFQRSTAHLSQRTRVLQNQKLGLSVFGPQPASVVRRGRGKYWSQPATVWLAHSNIMSTHSTCQYYEKRRTHFIGKALAR